MVSELNEKEKFELQKLEREKMMKNCIINNIVNLENEQLRQKSYTSFGKLILADEKNSASYS